MKIKHFVTGVCALQLLVFAFFIFPIPGTDSKVFIPAAISFAKGKGLVNPLYFVNLITDMTHTRQFNYYPPFYPLLLGFLSKLAPNIKTVFLMCSLFSVASLLVFNVLLKKLKNKFIFISTIAIVYLSGYVLPTVGRPECFTTLFSALLFWLYGNKSKIFNYKFQILAALLLSLILCTQLIAFYFCMLFVLIEDVKQSKQISTVIISSIFKLSAILISSFILLSFSPVGVQSTITGIIRHISYISGRQSGDLSFYIHFWIFNPLNFGFIFLFAIAFYFYFRDLIIQFRLYSNAIKVILALLYAFVVYGLIKYVFYASPTVYNVTQFIVPFLVFIIAKLNNTEKSNVSLVFKYSFAVIMVAGALIFLRWTVLFFDTQYEHKNWDSAKVELVKYLNKRSENIYITDAFWSMADNLDNIEFSNFTLTKPTDTIIFQQANNDFLKLSKNKYRIIYDWRTKKSKNTLNRYLTNNCQHYGFVICTPE